MSFEEDRRTAAIRALPVLPRTLFLLHNFYDVDIAAIAKTLGADEDSVHACLTAARSAIHRHWPGMPIEPCDLHGGDERSIELEQRLRREFRASLETAFNECGYAGKVAWSNPSASVENDEEAAATFIVSFLHPSLRAAVTRASRPGIATADLWRHAPWWQRGLRRLLLQVTSELRCSGWEHFDIWLAARIAPDCHYPSGIMSSPRLRRPLPEEIDPRQNGYWLPAWPDDPERQSRFDHLPELTQLVYGLFQINGRNSHEIARRLGIRRSSVRRRLHKAIYAVAGWAYPNIAWKILFAAEGKWIRRKSQIQRAWAAFRE
jgi:DNA-directed RNA polymerase specialized sigma24 family protein